MTQEEADNLRNSEFPELGPQTSFRLQVSSVPKLFFTVAQNMYYETLPKTWKLDISATVFNGNGEKIYTTDRTNPRPASKSMKYYPNIRDRKLKVSDDIGLKINLSKLEAEAQHIIITVDIKDLNGFVNAAANKEFDYARVRMCDFHTDQTFNEGNLATEFGFENLKDPNLEEEVKQSSSLICYYLYRSADYDWMVESLRLARNTSGEDGHSNLEAQLSKLILQSKESESPEPLVSERDQDKQPDEPVVDSKKATKGKEDPKQKDSKEPPKGQDKGGDKGKKKEEEKVVPKEEEKPKLVTRTFGPIDLIFFDPVEVVQEKVVEAIRKEQPSLLDTFEFGYEILIEDKPHVRPTQIKRITDIGSFEIKGKPRPPEEPKVEDDGDDVDGDGDGDDANPDDASDA